MQHTPGPWKATEGFAPDGSSLGLYIRSVRNHVAYMPGVGHQDFADAALIAAAPEMLTTLQAVLDRATMPGFLRDQVRAAISKATKTA